MKIGFDISQTGKLKAGCGYFADTILSYLTILDNCNQYFLYSSFGNSFFDLDHGRSTRRIKKDNFKHLLDGLSYEESIEFWSDCKPINEDVLGNPDIIHSNNFSCPTFKKSHVIYTLYDLSFLDYPEFTSEENRYKCFNGVFNASIRADFIVAISEFSRKRFLQIFPHFPEERTKTIYLASRFKEEDLETPVSGLSPNSFWLSVCTLEPRKNLRRTLRAYRKYIDVSLDSKPLVLAGSQGWLEDDIDDYITSLDLSNNIYKLGYVADPVLKWLYKNCWAFIYPSIYEGFGLPVLEAMSLGAAVITSRTTSLPEVGGNAVFYVDPSNETELTTAFETLENTQFRENLKIKGKNQSKHFDWEKTTSLILKTYESLLKMGKTT